MKHLDDPAISAIHCLGIGGIGVSGVAGLLHRRGYRITGSDAVATPLLDQLRQQGMVITVGHDLDLALQSDLILYSSAISADNPVLIAAKAKGIPLVSRGLMLAELMEDREGIAIAGTHGKTTTTSLVVSLLLKAGLDPSYLIGGRLLDQALSIGSGKGPFFIAEADESDGSFLLMRPKYLIVNNIEPDHLEYYGNDFSALSHAFLEAISHLNADGIVILGIDCPEVRALLPKIQCAFVTYGLSEDADYRAVDVRHSALITTFSLLGPEARSQALQLNLPGQHNVQNALASAALANLIGISSDIISAVFSSFSGVGRRFQYRGEMPVPSGRVSVYEDYGHHPTAIAATVEAAVSAFPEARIWVVFQPHRYSRTAALFEEFVAVLSDIQHLIVCETYAAGESPDAAFDSMALCCAIEKQCGQQPVYHDPSSDLKALLLSQSQLQHGDVLILQGAGNIGSMAGNLVAGEENEKG